MPSLRRDALRNRDRILEAARALTSSGQGLQLNSVARAAGVGVGTVYRHFPSTAALVEGLVEHRFVELTECARSALIEPDKFSATRTFLHSTLRLYAADAAFATSVAGPNAATETEALRSALFDAFAALLAGCADHFRADLDPADVMILLCGIGFSARLSPGRTEVYLDALLDGITVRPSRTP